MWCEKHFFQINIIRDTQENATKHVDNLVKLIDKKTRETPDYNKTVNLYYPISLINLSLYLSCLKKLILLWLLSLIMLMMLKINLSMLMLPSLILKKLKKLNFMLIDLNMTGMSNFFVLTLFLIFCKKICHLQKVIFFYFFASVILRRSKKTH